MWRVYLHNSPRAGRWTAFLARAPRWVSAPALTVAGLVLLVPVVAMVLFILAAVLAGLLVFLALGFLAVVLLLPLRLLRALSPRRHDDGRQNVRVIAPRDENL